MNDTYTQKEALKRAVRAILPLSHDELLYIREWIQHENGRSPFMFGNPYNRPVPAWETRQAVQPFVIKDNNPTLQDDRRFFAEVLHALITALQPVENVTDNARGFLQVKYIPRPKLIVEDDGEKITAIYVVMISHGPYLYLRRWASGGDRDKRKGRLKNHYIGQKELATYYESVKRGDDPAALEALTDAIITAWETDQQRAEDDKTLSELDRLANNKGIEPPEPVEAILTDLTADYAHLEPGKVKTEGILKRDDVKALIKDHKQKRRDED